MTDLLIASRVSPISAARSTTLASTDMAFSKAILFTILSHSLCFDFASLSLGLALATWNNRLSSGYSSENKEVSSGHYNWK